MNQIDDEVEKTLEQSDRAFESMSEQMSVSDALSESEQNTEHMPADNNADDAPQDEEKKPQKPFADILDWASSVVYAVALMLVVNLFIFRSITVRGDSMNDTLVNNDQVVVTNFFYKPNYGDIVVIQANRLNVQGTTIFGEPIIKRVIALAGDTIRIDYIKGEVYRNGELLSEDYIKELTHLYKSGYLENGQDYVVPENCVFVMGDNRNVSNDSRNQRDVGFIDEDMIIGKAFVRVSPIKDFKWL